MIGFLFRFARALLTLRAIRRGRIVQRLFNILIGRAVWRATRRFYR